MNRLAMALPFVLLQLACVKDSLWNEHHDKTYTAGDHITVSVDSIATVSATTASQSTNGACMVPRPGYLTIVSSRYYDNEQGNIYIKERACEEVMHNVRVNVKVVEGNPSCIQSLACTIDGLASRFDIAHSRLLGPAARVTDDVGMQGDAGTTAFRLLGTAADYQPLTLSLTQTDGQPLQVTIDATPVLNGLHPTLFELSKDDNISTSAHADTETAVNIDIELRIIPAGNGQMHFSATLSRWYHEDIDINAK